MNMFEQFSRDGHQMSLAVVPELNQNQSLKAIEAWLSLSLTVGPLIVMITDSG